MVWTYMSRRYICTFEYLVGFLSMFNILILICWLISAGISVIHGVIFISWCHPLIISSKMMRWLIWLILLTSCYSKFEHEWRHGIYLTLQDTGRGSLKTTLVFKHLSWPDGVAIGAVCFFYVLQLFSIDYLKILWRKIGIILQRIPA